MRPWLRVWLVPITLTAKTARILSPDLAKAFNTLFVDVVKEHPGNMQAAFNAFSSNPRAQQIFAANKRICVEFETKQRYGIHHQVKSP
jgi:hypothetical protein